MSDSRSWSIWKFAQNRENAQQFLVDLLLQAKPATIQSKLYNFPTFEKAFPFKQINRMAAQDTHKPHGKYTVLTTIAQKYTHNIGYPGTVNAAVDEILTTSLIPQMFAQVSQGKLSAEDSVAQTKKQINSIYAKWKARGKI